MTVLSLIFLFTNTNFLLAQASPIQAGSSSHNGDLYHGKSIGVGTNNPSADLHIFKSPDEVFGDFTSPSQPYLIIEGSTYYDPPTNPGYNSYPIFVVTQNGKLGIGMNNPSYKFDLQGNSRFNGAANFMQDVNIDDELTVEGISEFNDNINVAANLSVDQDVLVYGELSIMNP